MNKWMILSIAFVIGVFVLNQQYKSRKLDKSDLFESTYSRSNGGAESDSAFSDDLDKEQPIGVEIKISKDDPLKRKHISFFVASQKSILTRSERDRINELMSDRDVLDQSIAILTKKESQFFKEKEFERMNAVFFLTRALEWKNNPSRSYLLQEMKGLLLSYKTPQGLPPRLQKSRAADYVEVYKAVVENDPEFAEDLEREAQNKDIQKLINFTKRFYS